MRYLNFESLYDKFPLIEVKGLNHEIHQGIDEIMDVLKNRSKGVLVFECYPGVDLSLVKSQLIDPLKPDCIIHIDDYTHPEQVIDAMLKDNLTDDRVFGFWSNHTIEDFYPKEALEAIKESIRKHEWVIVYGFGASLIPSDTLIHVGLTRWEIQLRYRQGMPNFKVKNHNEDILRKYKRGYFVEWRVADRIKDDIHNRLDFVMDWTHLNQPVMITSKAYQIALDAFVVRPFRMVPYFDPGVWGGQWMKEVCHLDQSQKNFAWSFDGVPEENSVTVQFGSKKIDLPAQDIVQFRTEAFMGKPVMNRFGKHFPIRFDMLDTMEGEHLSLQVHPLETYIKETFGMTYTQDESYYLLDAKEEGTVFLGFKEDVDIEAFEEDLIKAEKGEIIFDAEKYVNRFPAKKHDHYSIPAGTIHCSGKNTMVLEISACVYIFTFKLWDWGRLGFDGKPRPVHLKHGFKSLQYDRDTKWVKRELINTFQKVSEHEEITGLHQHEFLETRRYRFDKPIVIDLNQTVQVANLVEGQAAIIESVDGSFEAYEVHYAETFILPATLNKIRIRSKNEHETCMMIKAQVRV